MFGYDSSHFYLACDITATNIRLCNAEFGSCRTPFWFVLDDMITGPKLRTGVETIAVAFAWILNRTSPPK